MVRTKHQKQNQQERRKLNRVRRTAIKARKLSVRIRNLLLSL